MALTTADKLREKAKGHRSDLSVPQPDSWTHADALDLLSDAWEALNRLYQRTDDQQGHQMGAALIQRIEAYADGRKT